jgi:hypothetical protein
MMIGTEYASPPVAACANKGSQKLEAVMFRKTVLAMFLGSLLLSLAGCYVDDDRGRDRHWDHDHDRDHDGGGVIVVPER